ncbi:MAG: sodium:calcium antiporter [Betaproteobacteria bacterium]|nr:sodium:calcium antiporter [Betaproteobacteria bacterium]
MVFLVLILMLFAILAASIVFTNALEHLGEQLGISEGATGSIFAAVGTALPETLMPIIAISAGTATQAVNEEIGVGAILGAPLMLSTLSLCLMALSTVRQRRLQGVLAPERTGLARDLNMFLFAFSLATVALFLPLSFPEARTLVAIVLILIYFVYLFLTLQASSTLTDIGHATEADEALILSHLGLPPRMPAILLQLALGLALLIGGAKGFVYGVTEGAHLLGLSPLLLSLVTIPIATELPEKVNSIRWIRRGKDTLAFGNITGAMVFQGTLLPAIGVLLTPWVPSREVAAAAALTWLSTAWLRLRISRGPLRVWHLAVNGALYAVYLMIALG